MPEPVVLTFEKFWHWLQGHPNCIVSAGTPEAMIYDQEEFHWHLGKEGDHTLLVQVLRGKQLVAELLLAGNEVSHVEGEAKGEDEFVFECMVSGDEGPVPAYYFSLSHGYDPEEPREQGRWVH